LFSQSFYPKTGAHFWETLLSALAEEAERQPLAGRVELSGEASARGAEDVLAKYLKP
jgi:hypothetical protein